MHFPSGCSDLLVYGAILKVEYKTHIRSIHIYIHTLLCFLHVNGIVFDYCRCSVFMFDKGFETYLRRFESHCLGFQDVIEKLFRVASQ